MVVKIDGEVYVLWGLCIIKIYCYFSFVFCCAKEGRVAEYNESDVGTLKILRQEEIVDKKRINFLASLYCSLLFSRKGIIKFTEVALVSVHCNCLIGWTVIVRRYRPWNTIDTTMDICLLVKNSNKKNVRFAQTFFISHFAALRPTLGHWQGGSLIHSMLITTLLQVPLDVCREPRNNVCSNSMTERISGIRDGNLPIRNVTCYANASLTLKVYQKQMTI